MGIQLPVSGIKSNMLKVVIFSALVAATCAAPVADGPPAYGPPHPVEKLPPQPFAYQYGVKDDYSGASFDKSESQSPDGRTQIVTYKADHYGGFVADVKYEGTAVYPPAPPGGYGPYKPARA